MDETRLAKLEARIAELERKLQEMKRPAATVTQGKAVRLREDKAIHAPENDK